MRKEIYGAYYLFFKETILFYSNSFWVDNAGYLWQVKNGMNWQDIVERLVNEKRNKRSI